METLSVIDCAIASPSNDCLNRLIQRTRIPFTYHLPAITGNNTYREDHNAKAIIVFGSHSSANDELPWQKEVVSFLLEKLKEGVPVFGLCFGHQLLAKAFGSTIGPSETPPYSHKGIREWEVLREDQRWGFCNGAQFNTIVYHKEEIKKLGSELIHLGCSKECNYDLITHKDLPFLGIQGHPEASYHFVYQEMELKDKVITEDVEKALQDGDIILDSFLESVGFFFDGFQQKFLGEFTQHRKELQDKYFLNNQGKVL